ncbi:MAG: isopentenyl phosphate kinase [Desulfurococcaceae archaeon]
MSHVFVKLGGSFITHKDKPVSVNYHALKHLREIFRAVLRQQGISVLVGNGGGSFAHYTVLKYANTCNKALLVKCHESTRMLNRMIVDYLLESEILATSVQTSSIVYYDESSQDIDVFTKPVEVLLSLGIIPVVYGDCVPTLSKPIIVSTERLFELIARYIKPRRIVLLSDVGGVYTCDPKACENPVVIYRITPSNIAEVLKVLEQSKHADATGGMFTKVQYMSRLAVKLGIDVVITSGFDVESSVSAILGGEPLRGTVIAPS